MDESKLTERMARANRALALQSDEGFNEVITELREQIVKAWKLTKEDARDERERLWLKIRLIDELLQELRITVQRGSQAQRDLENLLTNTPYPPT